MKASMLPYLLFSCLLLSVQAQNCIFSEIIRHTNRLLKESSVGCPCRETANSSCSCLPIPKPGHELACFVEGAEYMLKNNISSNSILERLHLAFQIQLDRSLCKSLAHEHQCQYKTQGDVKEFLTEILRTYQEINK
ncbi:IL9 protein, partial [Galbula dea]|nr:IL9 protein [Galbula dea]